MKRLAPFFSILLACGASHTRRTETPQVVHPEWLRAYAETNRFTLGHPNSFAWDEDGTLYFLRAENGRSFNQSLYRLRFPLGTEELVFSGTAPQEELSAEEHARRERLRQSSRGVTGFTLRPHSEDVLVRIGGKSILVSATTPRELPLSGAMDVRFSPDGSDVAFVRDGDLYAQRVADGSELRLLGDDDPQIEYGSPEFIAQEEFDRMSGYGWMPGGGLFVQRTDTRGVGRVYQGDVADPFREPSILPYPRAGADNAEVRYFFAHEVVPYVAQTNHAGTNEMLWDRNQYPYVVAVRASEADSVVFVVLANRLQNEVAVAVVTAPPGSQDASLRIIHRDTDATWVNARQDVPIPLSRDGHTTGFLWMTESTGVPTVVEVSLDGTLTPRSPSNLPIDRIVSYDETREELWLQTSEPSSARMPVKIARDGHVTPIGAEMQGFHDLVVSSDHRRYVLLKRTLDEGRTFVLGGDVQGEVRSVAESSSVIPNVRMQRVGPQQLQTALLLPSSIDNEYWPATLPVLIDVYGGPGVRRAILDRDRYLLDQWYAEQGFAVVVIDGRGTPGRTHDFERAIHHHLLDVPLADQIEGLQALAHEQPRLDLTRVAMSGWSFGGYLSAVAATARPDIFRAAIAGAPVTDWRLYDTAYTERYLGLPEAEGEHGVYEANRVRASNAVGSLLVIHGTADDNVYFSNSARLVDELTRAGLPFAFLPLRGATHMVTEPAMVEQLQLRMLQHLRDSLR